MLATDAGNFSRLAAGEGHPIDEIAERRTGDGREDELAFCGREDAVADESPGLLDVGDGIGGDVLFLNGPVERPLQGADAAVLTRWIVTGFFEPSLDVLPGELRDAQPYMRAKLLKKFLYQS